MSHPGEPLGAEWWETEMGLRKMMENFFHITVAVHKRRVALSAGVRESKELEENCDHKDWDFSRHWCNGCGVTLYEIVSERGKETDGIH